jgi:hypothetical protein
VEDPPGRVLNFKVKATSAFHGLVRVRNKVKGAEKVSANSRATNLECADRGGALDFLALPLRSNP